MDGSCPSTGQHRQEIPLENMIICSKSNPQRKQRPLPEKALKCPRCDSTNTKFCYYNNYSLSQPRYFCKSCRRYWTNGGALRNVPVGGGCRKNRRSSSSFPSSKRAQDQLLPSKSNPLLSYDSNDLTLAIFRLQNQSTQLGFDHEHNLLSSPGNPSNTHCDILGNLAGIRSSPSVPAFLGGLRSGFLDTQNGALQSFYGGEPVVAYDDMGATGGAVKEDEGNGGEEERKGVVPWQVNGKGEMEEEDFGRERWSTDVASAWHGLINTPLM